MAKRKVSLDTEKQREKLFLDIIMHLLRYNDAERRYIAIQAGVSISCIYSWTHGKTMTPRIDTLSKVARALGYEIVLTRAKSQPPKLFRVK